MAISGIVFNLEAYISKEFGRRIGTKEEEAFFIGVAALFF